eukprot:GFKZ01007738.1.p4 GENE.GFKZ01007738.1~~GFKZ01007738.1.p4  ORF type:complete len:116 (-),score=5.99 GFKZ01007738.1:208-555(-)
MEHATGLGASRRLSPETPSASNNKDRTFPPIPHITHPPRPPPTSRPKMVLQWFPFPTARTPDGPTASSTAGHSTRSQRLPPPAELNALLKLLSSLALHQEDLHQLHTMLIPYVGA